MKLWSKNRFPDVAPEGPPPRRRWPAIVGITLAAWALLGGVLMVLLQDHSVP
jgi:hypothetical protein